MVHQLSSMIRRQWKFRKRFTTTPPSTGWINWMKTVRPLISSGKTASSSLLIVESNHLWFQEAAGYLVVGMLWRPPFEDFSESRCWMRNVGHTISRRWMSNIFYFHLPSYHSHLLLQKHLFWQIISCETLDTTHDTLDTRYNIFTNQSFLILLEWSANTVSAPFSCVWTRFIPSRGLFANGGWWRLNSEEGPR